MRPPDKFNMIDMEGIDIITSQGEEIPGLYQKLVESIAQCRYQCLYNWKFDGILIPPTYVEMTIIDDVVWINEGVSVDEEDVIRIYSLEPPPAEPVIDSLSATENGTYLVPEGVDGFNPVLVQVPEPVFEIINITENGTYQPGQGVDGFSSVSVDVPTGGSSIETASVFKWLFNSATTCWGVMRKLSGDVIGINGDNANPNVVMVGDIMQVTFHGTSQNVEVVALSSIQLRVYRTGRTLGVVTPTLYTMSPNDQQSFTMDNLYGGLYLEAESA